MQNIATLNLHSSGIVSISFAIQKGMILTSGENIVEAIQNFYLAAKGAGLRLDETNTSFVILLDSEMISKS